MPSFDTTETITRFRHQDAEYELDHLGICHTSQAGTFVIYRDGGQVAEFDTELQIPPPGEPISEDLMTALISEAVTALAHTADPAAESAAGSAVGGA